MKVGSKVYLNGDPNIIMTISHVIGDMVSTAWFSDLGCLQFGTFHREMLSEVPPKIG